MARRPVRRATVGTSAPPRFLAPSPRAPSPPRRVVALPPFDPVAEQRRRRRAAHQHSEPRRAPRDMPPSVPRARARRSASPHAAPRRPPRPRRSGAVLVTASAAAAPGGHRHARDAERRRVQVAPGPPASPRRRPLRRARRRTAVQRVPCSGAGSAISDGARPVAPRPAPLRRPTATPRATAHLAAIPGSRPATAPSLPRGGHAWPGVALEV